MESCKGGALGVRGGQSSKLPASEHGLAAVKPKRFGGAWIPESRSA